MWYIACIGVRRKCFKIGGKKLVGDLGDETIVDHIPTSLQPRMISENAYCAVICSYFVNILCWLIFFLFFFGVENPCIPT